MKGSRASSGQGRGGRVIGSAFVGFGLVVGVISTSSAKDRQWIGLVYLVKRIAGGLLPAILHTMATTTPETKAVVAAEDDVPIQYMQRTRDYYLALGYSNPYRWAHFVDVPFTPLGTPLSHARVALITTAAPFQPDAGDQGPGAPYNARAKFYRVYSDSTASEPDLRISHVGYDRKH